MSVTNGQPASATVFNDAFVSKTADSEVISIITLNNTATASGDQITNLQEAVNSGLSNEYAEQTLGGGDSIDSLVSVGRQLRPIKSSGGEIVLDGLVFGNKSFVGGIEITLVGTNDTDYIKIENPALDDTDNYAILNGSIELKKYTAITFRFSARLNRWIEISRNL